MLKNDYLFAKIGVDAAENELFKVQLATVRGRGDVGLHERLAPRAGPLALPPHGPRAE